MSDRRTYSRDEIQAILARAIDRQARDGDQVTAEQLHEAAREVGLSPEEIDTAAREIEAERDLARHVATARQEELRGLWPHVLSFLGVNAGLHLIDRLTPGPPWSFWVLFGWGIGLLAHLAATAWPDQKRLERKAKRRQQREARRQKRHGQAADLHAQAADIEARVEAHVQAGLEVLQRLLDPDRRRGGKG